MICAPWTSGFHGIRGSTGARALAAGLDPDARIVGADDGDLVSTLALLADAVEAEKDDVPVVVFAECTLAPGIVAGIERRLGMTPAVLWFDAHGDLNTPESSPSGFAGGMPLAALVGWCQPAWREAGGMTAIPEAHVALVDGRDLDPAEADLLRASAIIVGRSAGDVLDALAPDRPIYLHFDTDVLDPADVAGSEYEVPGGPTAAELIADLGLIRERGRTIAGIGIGCGSAGLDAGAPIRGTVARVLGVLAAG